MDDISFTKLFSKWLNIFLNDLDSQEDKILEKVETFPGNKEIVRKAIQDFDSFDKKDESIASEIVNFIEYYATGNFHPMEVKYTGNKMEIISNAEE